MEKLNTKQLSEKITEEQNFRSGLKKTVEEENRSLTVEEAQQWDQSEEREAGYEAQKRTLERFTSKPADIRAAVYAAPAKQERTTQKDFNNAIRGLLLSGRKEQTNEYREAMDKFGIAPNDRTFEVEVRAQGIVTEGEGQETFNGSIHKACVEAQKAFGGVESVADVYNDSDSGPMHFSTNDDTGNVAGVVSDLGDFTNTNVSFDKVELTGFDYRTGVFPISNNMIRNSKIDIGALVGKKCTQRMARAKEAGYTSGAGTDRISGFLLGATEFDETASASELAYEDITGLYYSVDKDYREDPSCVFMCHDSVAEKIGQIVDGVERPLWGPGLNGAPVMTIMGKRVVINNSMPVWGSGNKILAFGAFDYYKIRLVGGLQIKVLNELYALKNAVGVFAIQTVDGKLVDPGNHPIKYLTLKAAGSGA